MPRHWRAAHANRHTRPDFLRPSKRQPRTRPKAKEADRASKDAAQDAVVLSWWGVRRRGHLQAYVGICWAFTPPTLAYARWAIEQNLVAGFAIAALLWTAGHAALTWYVLRHGLIQPGWRTFLFVATEVLATAGVAGIAVLIVIPQALYGLSLNIFTLPPALFSTALALLLLTSGRSPARSSIST